MLASRVIEPAYVFEDRPLSLSPRLLRLPPDQFSFVGFEECLDGGIEAPVFVKRRFELFLGRKAGCRFRERCSVLGNE